MSELEERTAPLADKRSISVRAKLRNAFIGIAAFSLLAAIVGIVSYQTVELAQQAIIGQALPAARHVGEVVVEGAAAIDKTTALAAATNDEEVAEQHTRIKRIETSIRTQLRELPRIDAIRGELDRFVTAIDGIFDVLEQQTSLVKKRNLIFEQRKQLASETLDACRKIADILRPAIIEVTTSTFTDTDRIRSNLSNPKTPRREVADQFDRLMSKEFRKMQLLTSMRDQTGRMIVDIEALLLSRSLNSVAIIRDKLNIHLRSLGRITVETRDRDFQRAIGKYLRRISGAIRNTDNLIEIQSSYLGTIGKIDALSTQNRNQREQFGLLAVGLQKAVDQTIAASTERAQSALWYGRFSLVAIAVLAFLSAIWVIWRYVLSDVAARIDRIASITRKLAAGDLDVEIDISGSDELGDVAEAMRLFKSNAIELQRSNAELEQFAYVASHDLKAPLRGISNLANWLEEDMGDSITEDSREHLNLINNRIDRLSALLDDLLQYSRAGREKSEIRSVNLEENLPELFRLVSVTDHFRMNLADPMPTLETAIAPIEQIFRNLFNNAIKHHDLELGTITVHCEYHQGGYEFSVQDDGPGIASEYQERVFGMFQTIRSRDEVEGSGIGLSVSKKLVESAGGRIWIVSDPASRRGTAIHFTWPVRWPSALISK